MPSETDRIVKTTVLHAPLDRVWSAVSDATQFGTWFGAEFDAPFSPGARMTGRIRPTQVDAEVAALQAPHDGMPFVVMIEAIEPLRRFAFRWHPYAVESHDYDSEPTTLVEFVLAAVPGGTELTVTESGFDAVPLERRAAAFAANEGGWTHQLVLIGKFLLRPE